MQRQRVGGDVRQKKLIGESLKSLIRRLPSALPQAGKQKNNAEKEQQNSGSREKFFGS